MFSLSHSFCIRYTKPKGQLPDYQRPVVLQTGKSTVEDLCNQLHKTIMKEFKQWVYYQYKYCYYCLVTEPSAFQLYCYLPIATCTMIIAFVQNCIRTCIGDYLFILTNSLHCYLLLLFLNSKYCSLSLPCAVDWRGGHQ